MKVHLQTNIPKKIWFNLQEHEQRASSKNAFKSRLGAFNQIFWAFEVWDEIHYSLWRKRKKKYVLNKHKGPTFENSKPHIILNQPGKHQLYATSKKPQGSCRGSLSTAMSFNFFGNFGLLNLLHIRKMENKNCLLKYVCELMENLFLHK